MSHKCQELNSSNVHQLLDSVDVVLSDCDGVLWTTDTVIPGAPEAIAKLKKMGKKVCFVTNNSNKSRLEYIHKFTGMGYEVVEEDIYTSASVAAEFIKKKLNYTGKVYCIGSRGLEHELKLCNIEPTEIGPDPLGEKTLADLEAYPLDPDVHCVVVGLDYEFSFVKACKAAAYLQNKSCKFVATNHDSNLPTASGRLMPCCGSILAMIEMAGQRRADVICGKPNRPMYDVIQERLHLNRRRTLFVGDRLNTDIMFAGRSGFQSLFVLSGVHQLENVKHLNTAVDDDHRSIPDYYISSMGDLGKLL